MTYDVARFSLALMILCCVSSCKNMECSEYYNKFDDVEFRKSLVDWADGQVFGKKFNSSDFSTGHLVGPGDPRSTFSASSKKITLLASLNGYEVRVLNDDKYNPEAVFVGKNSYHGFVISKFPINSYSEKKDIKIGDLDKKEGRVGVVCVSHLR